MGESSWQLNDPVTRHGHHVDIQCGRLEELRPSTADDGENKDQSLLEQCQPSKRIRYQQEQEQAVRQAILWRVPEPECQLAAACLPNDRFWQDLLVHSSLLQEKDEDANEELFVAQLASECLALEAIEPGYSEELAGQSPDFAVKSWIGHDELSAQSGEGHPQFPGDDTCVPAGQITASCQSSKNLNVEESAGGVSNFSGQDEQHNQPSCCQHPPQCSLYSLESEDISQADGGEAPVDKGSSDARLFLAERAPDNPQVVRSAPSNLADRLAAIVATKQSSPSGSSHPATYRPRQKSALRGSPTMAAQGSTPLSVQASVRGGLLLGDISEQLLATSPCLYPALVPCSSLARERSLGELLPEDELLRQRLISFAEAIATNDQVLARLLMPQMKKEANPMGRVMQRLTFYFTEALLRRTAGEGLANFNLPMSASPQEIGEAMAEFVQRIPWGDFCYETTAAAVASALCGCPRVHVIDVGLWQGEVWPYIMRKLHCSLPDGSSPFLRLTSLIDPSINPLGLNESRQTPEAVHCKIMAAAEALGMQVQFQAVHMDMATFKREALGIEEGEAIAVSCSLHLQYLLDGTVLRSSPRDQFLKRIRELQPQVFVVIELDVNHNGPFFLARFKEALDFYTTVFASHEGAFMTRQERQPGGNSTYDRWHHNLCVVESNMMGRDIVNVVACEGLQRMLRSEPLGVLCQRMQQSGFAPVPLACNLLADLQAALVRFPPGWSIQQSQEAAQLCWKKQSLVYFGAWRPLY